jgi:putative ABC transport system permease protein
MIRVTLRGVRGHLLRFLLTALAVTLGVSLVSGTFVLTDSIDKTFDDLITAGSNGVDVQVRGDEGDASSIEGGTIRTPLPLELQNTIRDVDGVKRAVPDYTGTALLVGKDGTAVRNGGAPAFGFAYFPDDPALRVVDGRGPENPGEVAAESSTLKLSGLKVGDSTKALVGQTPRTVKITGEVKFDAGLAGATIIVVDEKTAQAAFAPDGRVQSFTVTADPGVSQSQLRDRVAAVLPADAEAITGATFQDETKEEIDQVLGFISTFLLVFALLSLFVGLFIIFNTFSMLVAQRTRELALLRAVGASRGQVLRLVLGEAFVLGLLGALAGLGVGLLLASGLQALFGSFGLEISGGLPVLPRTIIVSVVAGLVVTLLSALIPAFRATRIAPVVAMRDDVAAPVGGVLRRGIIGLVLVAVGVAIVVPSVTGDEVKWLLVGVGSFVVLIGTIVAAPAAARPVVRVVAAPFVTLGGTVSRMSRENALRNPRRTATTATALMIGLALMAGISVIAASMRASVSDLVERQLTADYVLNGGNAPFPPSVSGEVSKLPDVTSVAQIGYVNVKVGDDTEYAISATSQGIEENVKTEVQSGSLSALDSGQVVVSETAAKDHGWKVGTTLTGVGLGALTGQTLTVGAIIADNQVLNNPAMIVPREIYERAIPAALQGDFLVYVKAREGTDAGALREQLTKVVEPFIVVSVQDGDEFTSSQADQVNQLLYIMYALLALTIIIAVLGIINTMALSVFERTREIGLLRAVGLSRRQLRRMITLESVQTSVFGAILGAVLGLAIGVVVQRGLVSEGLEELSIPWLQIVAVVVGAAIAGVVAAILPAWRAARLDVLGAISTE